MGIWDCWKTYKTRWDHCIDQVNPQIPNLEDLLIKIYSLNIEQVYRCIIALSFQLHGQNNLTPNALQKPCSTTTVLFIM